MKNSVYETGGVEGFISCAKELDVSLWGSLSTKEKQTKICI